MTDSTETLGAAPCDDCGNRIRCAREKLACQQYVSFCNPRGDHTKFPRIPSRVDYLRAHEDLKVHECFKVIAEVKRRARAENRMPTITEMMKGLQLDKAATVELLARYMARQGMTGDVATDDGPEGGRVSAQDSPVDA